MIAFGQFSHRAQMTCKCLQRPWRKADRGDRQEENGGESWGGTGLYPAF